MVRACPSASGTRATCFADVVVGRDGSSVGRSPAAAKAPIVGLRPADIASAYRLTGGSSGVIAVVDAYDYPNAEADLATYRAQWKLPACTTANGCFRKVNQRGDAAPLPEPDPGWGVEIALDLDAVSAACPACSILLVEGDSAELVSLGVAVNTAVSLGARAVSNSYGTDEFNGMTRFGRKYYAHPGVPIVVSSGDYGFTTAQFPAVLPTSIAAGGTSLTTASTPRGWSEKAWRGAGSGCSAYIAKPAWQHDNHCQMRTVADVSAVADPDTGLAIYDTFDTEEYTNTGWLQVGGTSLSSPLVAAMIVRAGHTTRYSDASSIYANASSFTDVVGGSNGYCGHDYLCTGKPGYDAPTGVGTPVGLSGL